MRKRSLIAISLTLVALVCFTILLSCESEPVSPPNTERPEDIPDGDGTKEPGEKSFPYSDAVLQGDNPYDWIGEMHNDCVDKIIEQVTAKGTTPSEHDICVLASELVAEGVSANLGVDPIEESHMKTATRMMKESFKGFRIEPAEAIAYVGSLADQGIVSQDFSQFARTIILAANRGSHWRLNRIEQRIIEADIDEAERASLLAMTSVWRHSLKYWSRKLGDDVVVEMNPILAADIAGACFGAGRWFWDRYRGVNNDWWDLFFEIGYGAASWSAGAWLVR